MSKQTDYEKEIRQRITKRYENRAEFYGHLIAFIVFNGVLWGVLHPVDAGYTISTLISGLWGLGLAVHFIQFLMKEAQEKAIEKAIERERQWRTGSYAAEETDMKRKRDRLTGLSDDGELYEIIEDDEENQYRQP
jgi:2TM domain-containing protein